MNIGRIIVTTVQTKNFLHGNTCRTVLQMRLSIVRADKIVVVHLIVKSAEWLMERIIISVKRFGRVLYNIESIRRKRTKTGIAYLVKKKD